MSVVDEGGMGVRPARKTPGRTVIAHLSDLHFDKHSDPDTGIWLELRADLDRHRIDLLVVSGDLVDNSAVDYFRYPSEEVLRAVYTYVVGTLCEAADLDADTALLVVPGNHDYRTQGLLRRKQGAAAFHRVFGALQKNVVLPNLRLACFVFDSNSTDRAINMASGRVQRDSFTHMHDAIATYDKTHEASWHEYRRVAILHHHPMPIGPTEASTRVRDQEQFMLLNNAGEFLTEIARARIDLVLHGHKHYPSYSFAGFPGSVQDHVVTVIGAGSVGKRGQHDLSYNLITLFDNGQVTLDRRVHRVTYGPDGESIQIIDAEQARRRRLRHLAPAAGAQLSIAHYVRHFVIADRTGDAELYEQFSQVQPRAHGEVTTIESQASGSTAIFGDPHYRTDGTQRIVWKWIDSPRRLGARKAVTEFTPPLRRGAPRSFDRSGLIYNAFHFNERDRCDAQRSANDGTTPPTPDARESVKLHVREEYEMATMQVTFPAGRWPQIFTVDAVIAGGSIDPDETRFIEPRFTRSLELRTAQLSIPTPLPGYTYYIRWDLPKTEIDETSLSPADIGMAAEMIKRLLACAQDSSGGPRLRIDQLLDALRAQSKDVAPGTSVGDVREIEACLFCYDPANGRLVVVAHAGFSGRKPPDRPFRPGEGIVGQAFRRYQPVLCLQSRARGREAVYYEPSNDGREPHTVVLAVPLFLPRRNGQRIAVVTLASRSNVTWLLNLGEDEAAKAALTAEMIRVFEKQVVRALGLVFPGDRADSA